MVWGIALSAVLLGNSLHSVSADEAFQSKINWLGDPRLATQIAREHDLPVLVYVTSSDCFHCRKMERQTWSHAQVIGAVNGRYVALKLTPERHPDLVQRLKVQAFPTTFVLNAQLKYHAGAIGFQSPGEMTQLLKQRPASVARLDYWP